MTRKPICSKKVWNRAISPRPTRGNGTLGHVTKKYDFANILFAGPCNQRCPYCIGRQVDPAFNRNNLDEFPLLNLERFAGLLRQHRVQQIILTGTNTDPQLYHHEARLLRWLREQVSAAKISLHTNGQRALAKMDVFNLYDRASISFPSFDLDTFEKMTGTRHMPDLAAIVQAAHIPIKVSCVIDEHNAGQVDEFIARCREIGVRRLVFRQLYGDPRRWEILPHLRPVAFYHGNPVYNCHGIEVTLWDFDRTTVTALNLFSDGSISTEYLLVRQKDAGS
jgi:MoaA/NifB/PqqE/SkfB family radical SAM enzyme